MKPSHRGFGERSALLRQSLDFVERRIVAIDLVLIALAPWKMLPVDDDLGYLLLGQAIALDHG